MTRVGLVVALSLGLCLPFAGVSAAQDAQTLADIRQEAAVLSVELQRLKRELSTTGAPSFQGSAGPTLERVDLMEAALARLTSKVEELEYRVDRVVQDGTNQLDDLNFRLCELEAGCDIGNLPPLTPIGGVAPSTGGGAAAPVTESPMDGGTEMAITEQSDYDAAMTAYNEGRFAEAAQKFDTFAQTYTGGPLTGEAHYMRGQSLAAAGDREGAARAYLDSFSGNPEGNRAPGALLQLGVSLAELGQVERGCMMLTEVGVRFPASPEEGLALNERRRLGCP